MRRGAFVSSVLIAGLAQCAPAAAGVEDKPTEAAVQVEAPAAKAEAAVAKVEAPVARTGKPAPLLATPNGQVMDRAREIAEADLAAAPVDEIKPFKVDPNQAGKRASRLAQSGPPPAPQEKPALDARAPEPLPRVAEARGDPTLATAPTTAMKPALDEATPEPQQAALAERQPEPSATPGSKAEEQPALAERESEPRHGGDPVVRPIYAQRRYQTAEEPAANVDGGDPVVRPNYRERRWEPKPVREAERTPEAEPETRASGRPVRPDYVEAERIVRVASAHGDNEVPPVIEAGRVAAAAPPPAPVATEVSVPMTQTAQAADIAPAARTEQGTVAGSTGDAAGAAVADATNAAAEAGDGGLAVLRDAARAARVVGQAGRVAKTLGGAAVGAAADARVHGDEEREQAPVYAEEEGDADRGDRRDDPDEEPVFAEERREVPVDADEDRVYPPVHADDEPPLRPRFDRDGYDERWASRDAGGSCDRHRYEGLSRAVRRAAEAGSIGWRTARDMEDEIAHGEEMQRGYCASGLDDWRARRLDAQYSQIEDRLRFARGRLR